MSHVNSPTCLHNWRAQNVKNGVQNGVQNTNYMNACLLNNGIVFKNESKDFNIINGQFRVVMNISVIEPSLVTTVKIKA